MSDPGRDTARAYGVLRENYAARHTFYIGKDGRILSIDREVKPSTAGEDLVARLEELEIARRPK